MSNDDYPARGRALTNAEKNARWRAKNGGRTITYHADAPTAAALIFLRRSWGFKSNRETVQAAIRYLAVLTRKGVTRLDLEV